jgi:hypothetical protein
MARPGEGIGGTRKIGGRYVAGKKGEPRPVGAQGEKMRSRSEANYSHFLAHLGIPYAYEPKRFHFAKARGARNSSILIDFYLPRAKEYHEVKPFRDKDSEIRLRSMTREYPTVKVVVIDGLFFRDVERRHLCRVIPGWVCAHRWVATL